MCMCIHIHDIEIDRFPVQLRRKVQQTRKVGALSLEMLVCFLMLCVMGVAQGLAARPHH